MSEGPHADPHALTAAYALGALDPAERALAQAHLDGCPQCTAELPGLLETTAHLGEAAAARPPARLRAATLAVVAAEGRGRAGRAGADAGAAAPQPAQPPRDASPPLRRSRPGAPAVWWVAAAAAVVIAAVLGFAVGHRPPAPLAAVDAPLSAVVHAPDVRITTASPSPARGWVVWSAATDVAVYVVAGLPPAPAGHVYQMWLRQPGGVFASAGLLQVGSGAVRLDGSVASATGFGLTVEPAGGSAHPTTTPLVLTPLA